MIDDPEYIARRIAYVDTLRNLHKHKRLAGLMGCIIGVVLLGLARMREPHRDWLMWVALGVISVSWVLFGYVIYARTRYVRAHPFERSA